VCLCTDACVHARMFPYIPYAHENNKSAMNVPMYTENTKYFYSVGPEY